MKIYSKWTLIITFGAMSTIDETMRGYYLIKQISEPYTVQEHKIMKEVELQQYNLSRKLICDMVFMHPVSNAIDWYTPMDKINGFVMITLKKALQTDLKKIMIDEENKLRSKCNKHPANNLGVTRIDA